MSNKITDNSRKSSSASLKENDGGAVDEQPRRRLKDRVESKNPTRSMNFDRRLKNNDRRTNYDSDYKGPSRRLTIDRRLKPQDRRKHDKDDDTIY